MQLDATEWPAMSALMSEVQRSDGPTIGTAAGHGEVALRDRLVETLSHLPTSVMLFDAEDRLVFCNEATARYFPTARDLLVPGTKYEDLLRAHAVSGYVAGVGDDFEAWIAGRVKSHRAAEASITRTYADGTTSQIVERHTSDGGTICIRTDVTEIRAYEAELARKNAEIEDYTKELERSNRDLEQFAYLASHDLQEPLRMVASYCRLLQRRYQGKLDTDADEFIGYAVEGADRMQRLVNDLLGYSRVGRHGTNSELLAARKIVETALQNLQSAIADAGARITMGDLPTIAGDPTQLVQLFQNLIGNAIKFHGETTPVIHVDATLVDGAWVEMTVADSGIGIEPEFVERVFLIFQRLHPRDAYPGTGIGLAIVKKVVENHGGRVWIES